MIGMDGKYLGDDQAQCEYFPAALGGNEESVDKFIHWHGDGSYVESIEGGG
jgi:hypothetical protein